MIAELESRILTPIDGMVDHTNDDESFASGYPHGHLTSAIVELGSGSDHPAQAAHTTVSQSLEKTTGVGELSPRNQALATDMRGHLLQQASQQQIVTSGAPCLIRCLSRLVRPTDNAQVG